MFYYIYDLKAWQQGSNLNSTRQLSSEICRDVQLAIVSSTQRTAPARRHDMEWDGITMYVGGVNNIFPSWHPPHLELCTFTGYLTVHFIAMSQRLSVQQPGGETRERRDHRYIRPHLSSSGHSPSHTCTEQPGQSSLRILFSFLEWNLFLFVGPGLGYYRNLKGNQNEIKMLKRNV